MESPRRGQLPACHTKAVENNQRPLNTGSLGSGLVCSNDVTSSKPCCQGRGVIDGSQTGNTYRSVRCNGKSVRHATI